MSVLLACLTGGKIWLVSEGEEPRELASPYAEQVRNRERQINQRHAWKSQGRGAQFMGGGRSMLWGDAEDALPVARIVGVSRGRAARELFYSVTTGVVSGIFAQTPSEREPGAAERVLQSPDEQRIFHNANLRVSEVALSLADEAIACTVEGKGGSSAIGVLADDGRGVRTVTEGDVVDRAPRWVPGGKRQIVYASAGIGRSANGLFGGLAPFGVHRLSLRDGSVEVVALDAKSDFLAPVPSSEDEIYAIRRPYRQPDAAPSLGRVIADALLLPLRGNAKQKAADAEQMMVWGNRVDTRQQATDAASTEKLPARGYDLVRITRQGITRMQTGVLAFDLAPDGSIYYSSGTAVYRLQGSRAKKLADIEHVDQLVVSG